VFAPDKLVPRVVETITRSAKTGSVGDGKIFVSDLSFRGTDQDWRDRGKRIVTITASDTLAYVIDFEMARTVQELRMPSLATKSRFLFIRNRTPGGSIVCQRDAQPGTARLFIVEITTADGKHQSFECEYPLLQLISQVLQPSHRYEPRRKGRVWPLSES